MDAPQAQMEIFFDWFPDDPLTVLQAPGIE
jgi:hypothetical protein